MFRNNLKIALRNAVKDRSFTVINVLGLAIGMACFMLFMRHIHDELRYDTFHEHAGRIYRIAVETSTPHDIRYSASTPYPVAPPLREAYPEFEKMARMYAYGDALIEANGKKIYDENFFFAEPEFFDIFSFPFLQGNPATALQAPNSVLLTQSTAAKYFGDSDPVGQTFRFENKIAFIVTGVLADPPANSHFHFSFLASFDNVTKEVIGFDPNQWGAFFGIYTYALLPARFDVAALEEKLRPFYNAHAGDQSTNPRRLILQPLTSIHLHSHFESEIEPNTSMRQLVYFGTIGLLVLLIACINFINLATARSLRRSKEVGVRKVLGAARLQLIRQYLGESIFFSAIALLFGFGLAELLRPLFSDLLGKSIAFDYSENLPGILLVAGFTLLIGVLAGLYPAFILSKFKPVETLKGEVLTAGHGRRRIPLRKLLVVMQFSCFVLLAIAMAVMHLQLRFVKSLDLGFDKELTVVISLQDRAVQKQYQILENAMRQTSGVRAVAASYKAPIGKNEFVTSLFPRGAAAGEQIDVFLNFIDYDYLNLFDLELLAGRNLSPDFATDLTEAFIINRATMKALGIARPEEAIGQKVTIGVNQIEGTIIGVTEDFHIQSLHQEIAPLVMLYWPYFFNTLSAKIDGRNLSATLAALENTWNKHVTEFPFQYTFLDAYIASLYEAEEKHEKTIQIFSLLTIFVACLGLFGLAALAAEQRTKEIGIRKVLGATITGVIGLLSKDFVKLVLLANLIAWPIAWYAMNRWLQNFAYRIDIGWWVFALAGGLALLIAILTVSTQAIKAALANPVEALRYE